MVEEFVRVRLPKRNEVLGQVLELLGASRFKVDCNDGNVRICRIPGKHRKRVNVSVGDIALVRPWDIQPDERGDVLWIYNKTQANWLRRKGYI